MNKVIVILLIVFSGHMAEGQVSPGNKRNAQEDLVVVTGRVFNASILSGGITLLNIGGSYPDHLLEVFIQAEDRFKFQYKPEEKFIGKFIQVTGSFMDSGGKLQMKVRDPTQLAEVINPKTTLLKLSANHE